MKKKTVAGEPVELLRMALARFTHAMGSDGKVELSATLGPELGHPLMRAMSRIERELWAEDLAQGNLGARTIEQRRADALVLLVERLPDPSSE